MKLATALSERADIQTRLSEIGIVTVCYYYRCTGCRIRVGQGIKYNHQ